MKTCFLLVFQGNGTFSFHRHSYLLLYLFSIFFGEIFYTYKSCIINIEIHACYTINDYLILYLCVCVCVVIQTWSMGNLYLKISPPSKWLMDKGPGGHLSCARDSSKLGGSIFY